MSKEPIKKAPREVSKDAKMPTYQYQTAKPGSLKVGSDKNRPSGSQVKHLLQNLG